MVKKGRLRKAVSWYLRGGLFHPLYFTLILLFFLIMYSSTDSELFESYLWFYTDLMFIPLIALISSIHVVREPEITVFELNIFKSYGAVFAGRMVSLLSAISLAIVPLIAVLAQTGTLGSYVMPLLQRVLTYLVLVSVVFLVDSQRGALIYLVVFYFVLPFSAPIFLERIQGELAGANFDVPLFIFMIVLFIYIIAPFTTNYVLRDLIDLMNNITVLSIGFSIVIILINYILFSKKEFSI
ncbi:MAG: hypothetical protein F7C07_07895 [Desulfurococcales archaeon]|nr:hypothetical protein [Desulfurococcales archaeon]